MKITKNADLFAYGGTDRDKEAFVNAIFKEDCRTVVISEFNSSHVPSNVLWINAVLSAKMLGSGLEDMARTAFRIQPDRIVFLMDTCAEYPRMQSLWLGFRPWVKLEKMETGKGRR